MAHTNIRIELEFGESNGLMETHLNGVNITPAEPGVQVTEMTIDIPGNLTFTFNGKQGRDTILDGQGQIARDKYVKINSMSIGLIPINQNLLYSLCQYRRNDETVNDTFFGFNGELVIHIDNDDAILWHLLNNNKFEI